MADMKLTIYTQGGFFHEIEAPPDIRTSDLVKELAKQLLLPALDAEGHPVVMRLYDMDTGMALAPDITLEKNGVQSGHRLSMRREVVGGCFAESCRVLLPDGSAAPIGNLRSGDRILAFNASDLSYGAEPIEGIYQQTFPATIKLNDTLETTGDQHLLLADRRWTLAEGLKPGDSLLSFPFGTQQVTSIDRLGELKNMRSLTLKQPFCLVVEGLVARDFVGKQEFIPRAVDVFLSYSVGDKDQARRLFELLEENGRAVFLSEKLSPGDKWAETILESLKGCGQFWLLVTPDSLRSEWVTTEWAAAWALEKKIIPILFRCRPEDLPGRLRDHQCIDFHQVGEWLSSPRSRD
jgi:hypothetical protein